MANPQASKGARAEREIAGHLTDLLGFPVVRRRNLGTHDDRGDLVIPRWTLQVKNYKDQQRAVSETLNDLYDQMNANGTALGAGLIRRPGGRWYAVIPLDVFATVIRETL